MESGGECGARKIAAIAAGVKHSSTLDYARTRCLRSRFQRRPVWRPHFTWFVAPLTHPARALLPKTLIMLTQTFPPDAAAVGQHFGDAARELARRGLHVVVYTSAAGYDDPSVCYLHREVTPEGVDIRRLSFTSLGKSSIARRIVAAAAFMLQCAWLGIRAPRLDGILFSTSPPLIGVVACLVGRVRRVPVAYWAMDLNPDQLIALGKVRSGGVLAGLLGWVNRVVLKQSALIVTLDHMMAGRLGTQGVREAGIEVIPPWSPDDAIAPIERHANEFRRAHSLRDAVVVMYSGNHTSSNPLTTLLDAAVALRDDEGVRFVFVGGGVGKAQVDYYMHKYRLSNVLSLPYEPRERLGISLSAADIHAVSLGNQMVGIIHPCKIYGAMAVARPILYFGPSPSHISALLQRYDIGWCVAHGNVVAAVSAIEQFAAMSAEERDAIGMRARTALMRDLAAANLCAHFCDVVEERLGLSRV